MRERKVLEIVRTDASDTGRIRIVADYDAEANEKGSNESEKGQPAHGTFERTEEGTKESESLRPRNFPSVKSTRNAAFGGRVYTRAASVSGGDDSIDFFTDRLREVAFWNKCK